MRYTVKCNECGRNFVAETEKYGTMKYRCPYCGNVLTCRFDAPTAFRTRARSVLPLKWRKQQSCLQLIPMCSTLHRRKSWQRCVRSWQKHLTKPFRHRYMLAKHCVMQPITQASLCRNQALVCANFRRSMRMATYGYSLDSAFCSSYQSSFSSLSLRRL